MSPALAMGGGLRQNRCDRPFPHEDRPMPHILICKDKPGQLALRQANRDAHLAYATESGVVAFGGPLLDAAGGMIGSMLVLDVEDRSDAESFAAGDPYAQAGLFETVEISGFRKVFG